MSTPKQTARIWAKPDDYVYLAELSGSDIQKAGGAKAFLEPYGYRATLPGRPTLNFNYEALDVAIYILSQK